jgi:hypothetical protein
MFGHLNLDFEKDSLFSMYRCGLCNAIGREYGNIARLFTNYDMALCLLATMSYSGNDIKARRKLCPIISINRTIDNTLPPVRYAAAITMLLVWEKIKDDIHDEERCYPGRALRWMEKKKDKAEGALREFGFETALLEKAFASQREFERNVCATLWELTEPSAYAMEKVYEHAAGIVGLPGSSGIFQRIGGSIGRIIYLLDGIYDYRDDMVQQIFNPLHRCIPEMKSGASGAIPESVKKEVVNLLKSLQKSIIESLESLPDHLYLREIFTIRLTKKLEDIADVNGSDGLQRQPDFFQKVRDMTPLTFLLSSRYAFASNGKDGLSGCSESVTLLIIMLIVYSFICKGCCSGCGRKTPDRVTVDHGCSGTKTYKKDPCTGKYKDNGCC